MNINKQIALISIFLFALASCQVFNSSRKNKEAINMQNQSIIMEPEVIQGFRHDKQNLSYSITDATLADTILTIELNYSGGCVDHSFDIIFNGMYKKSLPRQADLFLLHNNKGDTCTENKSIILRYNLSSIIGPGKQAVNFTLIGYPDKMKFGSVPKN